MRWPPRFWRRLHPWTQHGWHTLITIVIMSVAITAAAVPLWEGHHPVRVFILVVGTALALRMAKDNGINLAALRRRPDYHRNENKDAP